MSCQNHLRALEYQSRVFGGCEYYYQDVYAYANVLERYNELKQQIESLGILNNPMLNIDIDNLRINGESSIDDIKDLISKMEIILNRINN